MTLASILAGLMIFGTILYLAYDGRTRELELRRERNRPPPPEPLREEGNGCLSQSQCQHGLMCYRSKCMTPEGVQAAPRAKRTTPSPVSVPTPTPTPTPTLAKGLPGCRRRAKQSERSCNRECTKEHEKQGHDSEWLVACLERSCWCSKETGRSIERPPPKASASRRTCCKVCHTGIPCGDSCISAKKRCHKGPGCAC